MLRIALVLLTLTTNFVLASDLDCGDPFANGVGPWDYRNSEARNNPHKIPIVEQHHFTPKVEQLIKGEGQVDPAGDIDYVLRAVPNHHRALYAISRYERQRGKISAKWRTAECYFNRALRFRPDDGMVRMLLGIHWAIRDQHGKAIQQYEAALVAMPTSPELHYNMGLSFEVLGEYEKARKAAIVAYEGGYPLPGLRQKLEQRGFGWADE